MKVLFILFLTIASALAAGLRFDEKFIEKSPEVSALQPEERITYADKVNIKDYNYQVGLDSNGLWCGGALITNTYILTAAHCVYGVPPTKVIAYLGSATRKKGTKRKVESILMHAAFSINTLENDIALVRIPVVALSQYINVIGLPELGNKSLFEGDIAVASGWGETTADSAISKYLRAAELPIISNYACANTFSSAVVKSSTMCVSTLQKNSPCNSDLGGPLVHSKQNILVGVISFLSPLGCASLQPVGLSRITSHRDWIKTYAGI